MHECKDLNGRRHPWHVASCRYLLYKDPTSLVASNTPMIWRLPRDRMHRISVMRFYSHLNVKEVLSKTWSWHTREALLSEPRSAGTAPRELPSNNHNFGTTVNQSSSAGRLYIRSRITLYGLSLSVARYCFPTSRSSHTQYTIERQITEHTAMPFNTALTRKLGIKSMPLGSSQASLY